MAVGGYCVFYDRKPVLEGRKSSVKLIGKKRVKRKTIKRRSIKSRSSKKSKSRTTKIKRVKRKHVKPKRKIIRKSPSKVNKRIRRSRRKKREQL